MPWGNSPPGSGLLSWWTRVLSMNSIPSWKEPLHGGGKKKYRPGSVSSPGPAGVRGRQVYLYSQDFTVEGGSVGEREARKICKIMDMAMENGRPLIGINDSAGAKVNQGVRNFGFWNIFNRNVVASGVILRFSPSWDPVPEGPFTPRLLEISYSWWIRSAECSSPGRAVIKTVTSEEVSKEELGGAQIHNKVSGVSHFFANTEKECMEMIKRLLDYLPPNWQEKPPYVHGKR